MMSDYEEAIEPIRTQAEEIVKKKKKSAKEVFAETVTEVKSEPIEDDGVLDLKLELDTFDAKELLSGITTPPQPEDIADDKGEPSVYIASAVENVPAQIRDGMEIAGGGRRRRVKRKTNTTSTIINRNTFKAFPDKEIGSINKTTFKG